MGMTSSFEITDFSTTRDQIRAGFDAGTFLDAAERLGISQEELARCLGLKTRTLLRKRTDGDRLSVPESERIFRVHRVWNAARSLFTDDHAIAEFLRTPDSSLGASPLELLDTEVGANEVEGFIVGLAYGNFQ